MKSNSKGYHPIHYASVSRRGSFCLEHLISLGIDVNMKSEDGKTPLHITALHYNHSCAQNLICSGAKVDEKDNKGNTPLHIAAKIGDDIMISLLLDYRASIHM
jgi:ankyrin repeat protein